MTSIDDNFDESNSISLQDDHTMSNKHEIDDDRNTINEDYSYIDEAHFMPCEFCNRTFAPESLDNHRRICYKSWLKLKEKEAKYVENMNAAKRGQKKKEEITIEAMLEKNRSKRLNWRARHEEFQRALSRARKYTYAVNNNLPVPQENYEPIVDMDLISCDYCSRKFHKNSLDKHIKWCKEQSLKQNEQLSSKLLEAKHRLAVRLYYEPESKKPTTKSIHRSDTYSRLTAEVNKLDRASVMSAIRDHSVSANHNRPPSCASEINYKNMIKAKKELPRADSRLTVSSRQSNLDLNFNDSIIGSSRKPSTSLLSPSTIRRTSSQSASRNSNYSRNSTRDNQVYNFSDLDNAASNTSHPNKGPPVKKNTGNLPRCFTYNQDQFNCLESATSPTSWRNEDQPQSSLNQQKRALEKCKTQQTNKQQLGNSGGPTKTQTQQQSMKFVTSTYQTQISVNNQTAANLEAAPSLQSITESISCEIKENNVKHANKNIVQNVFPSSSVPKTREKHTNRMEQGDDLSNEETTYEDEIAVKNELTGIEDQDCVESFQKISLNNKQSEENTSSQTFCHQCGKKISNRISKILLRMRH